MAEWPGEGRRRPPISSPTWAVRAPLARWLEAEARAAGRVRVLDVGCGVKPYFPFFEPYAERYVGVDVEASSAADLVGSVEDLPVDDASFDVVLCTQVLEHAGDPARAVRELRRVTAPAGRVLASTHGVQVYHPAPEDLWRWTHAGLDRLFRENGDWDSVTVRPSSGTTACLGVLVSTYLDLLARRTGVGRASPPVVAAINRTAAALDRRSPALAGTGPGTLHANYHVVAEVAP